MIATSSLFDGSLSVRLRRSYGCSFFLRLCVWLYTSAELAWATFNRRSSSSLFASGSLSILSLVNKNFLLHCLRNTSECPLSLLGCPAIPLQIPGCLNFGSEVEVQVRQERADLEIRSTFLWGSLKIHLTFLRTCLVGVSILRRAEIRIPHTHWEWASCASRQSFLLSTFMKTLICDSIGAMRLRRWQSQVASRSIFGLLSILPFLRLAMSWL